MNSASPAASSGRRGSGSRDKGSEGNGVSLAKRFPTGESGESHQDHGRDDPQGLDVDEPEEALPPDDSDGGDRPQRQHRTYTHRERRVIVGSQVGSEDLGQVAPLSQEDDDERRRHDSAAWLRFALDEGLFLFG